MVEYIKKIADQITGDGPRQAGTTIFDLIGSLAQELARLDPRDFLPAAREQFAVLRVQATRWANVRGLDDGETRAVVALAKAASSCLALYGGEDSRAIRRSFAFVNDPDLRTIVERDYRELSLILLPGGGWKSVVVMSGSILEAILYDQLTKDMQTQSQATASSAAPPKDIAKGGWGLHELIRVALDLKMLPADRVNSIDQILRDYRNFVHPKKEIRNAHPCTEAEALLSKGALDSVCNHLAR